MPKAITGSAYRKLLQEKKSQREELEKEKEERKHERMVKGKMKEDEKIKTKAEKDAKRKEQAEKKENKNYAKSFCSHLKTPMKNLTGTFKLMQTRVLRAKSHTTPIS